MEQKRKPRMTKRSRRLILRLRRLKKLPLAIHDNFGVQLTDGMNEIIDQTTYGKYDSVFDPMKI